VISTLIVVLSLALAAGYVLAWLLMPGFRKRIEQPKYEFQNQLNRFDGPSG